MKRLIIAACLVLIVAFGMSCKKEPTGPVYTGRNTLAGHLELRG
jgi:hypothetical protein